MTRQHRRYFPSFSSMLHRLRESSQKEPGSMPLASSRKRALTAEATANAQPQLRSLLLTNLPPEIRRQIYEYIMGGRVTHLEQTLTGRLKNMWCSDTSHRGHGLVVRGDQEMCLRAVQPWDYNPMPLLLTCRKVYSEAIDLLYSGNVIHIGMNLDILELLPVYFLPQRFQAIASLELGPSSSFLKVERDSLEYKQWERVWILIASMQGLRHILVWLTGHQFDDVVLAPAMERLLLEPLLVVQGVSDFQVNLVSGASDVEMFPHAPFQVNRSLPDSEDRESLKEWVSEGQHLEE